MLNILFPRHTRGIVIEPKMGIYFPLLHFLQLDMDQIGLGQIAGIISEVQQSHCRALTHKKLSSYNMVGRDVLSDISPFTIF